MNIDSLKRIETLNYILGAAFILVSFALTSMYFTAGISLGVVLTCLNFSIIRHLVSKLLGTPPEHQSRTAFVFVPKMTGLLVLVALAVFFLPISSLGIGIGFSVFILSIMVEGVRFAGGSTLSD